MAAGVAVGTIGGGSIADAGTQGVEIGQTENGESVIDDSIAGWVEGTRELTAADPEVQAILPLLPPDATLVDARHVRGEGQGAPDHIMVTVDVGGVEYGVTVYRRFEAEELGEGLRVPGGTAWDGSSGTYDYLYFLSDGGRGVHVGVRGADSEAVSGEMMDLAVSLANDPAVLGAIDVVS